VLRLSDLATGKPQPIRPARPGALTIWVASPARRAASPGTSAARPPTWPVIPAASLRSCLVADLIRRVGERHNLLVSVWRRAPGTDGDTATGEELRTAWNELNIHPAQLSDRPPSPVDVAVAADGLRPGDGPAPHWLQPGEVRPQEADATGLDPLALRLVFLERHYRAPAILTRQTLETADQTLRGWRALVADWARSPSEPVSARHTGDALAAIDEDLDTQSALRTLEALAADARIPAGAKFETFAYLDQMLGLDVARDVGR
jgi:hypothetical protein